MSTVAAEPVNKPASQVITARLSPVERRLLEAVAAARGTFLSYVIRDAVREQIEREFGPEALQRGQ